MRKIGAYELKTHLSRVLNAVEHGQTVVVTRHGKPIARISPDAIDRRKQVSQAVKSLLNFPRTALPRGITIRSLIEEGRR
ncbi:MAG TPA: type II toxin-antitoxin system prevent-host-death family antitoxin [Phycisphaerae bacterium]|nr:type II toxin-antitoxin system prevent-host-death family antitoxin [Phycisphaerae bacterium]